MSFKLETKQNWGNSFVIKPATKNCVEVVNKGETAIIGISPFNSYFSEENIKFLCHWADTSFQDFYLFIPDVPSKYTLMAMAYDENKAEKKAKKQGRWYNNKARKALETLGYSDEKILNWNTLDKIDRFHFHLKKYKNMFNTNSYFRENCLRAANWVLKGKTEITSEKLEIAAEYFLAELPLIFNSNEITNSSNTSFCYHSCPDFVLETMGFDPFGIVGQGQAFGILNQYKG